MLQIFRSNQLLVSFFLLFYLLLLFSPVLIHPAPYDYLAVPGPLAVWALSWTSSYPGVAFVLNLFVLLIQVILLNYISNFHRVAGEQTQFPGVFFVLIIAFVPESSLLHPIHLANLFVLLGLQYILATFKKGSAAILIFNSGLFLGLAVLSFLPTIVFLALYFIGLSLVRSFDLREWLMVLSGLITPFVLLGTYFFWNDQFSGWLQTLYEAFFMGIPSLPAPGGWIDQIPSYLFGLMLLLMLVQRRAFLFKQMMEAQRRVSLIYWYMFLAGVAVFFHPFLTQELLLLVSPPLAVLLGIRVGQLSSRWGEFWHLALLLGALAYLFRADIGLV